MKQVALSILKGIFRLGNIASKFGSRLTFVYNRHRLRMYSEGKRARAGLSCWNSKGKSDSTATSRPVYGDIYNNI